jgi:hypothetical protein
MWYIQWQKSCSSLGKGEQTILKKLESEDITCNDLLRQGKEVVHSYNTKCFLLVTGSLSVFKFSYASVDEIASQFMFYYISIHRDKNSERVVTSFSAIIAIRQAT